MSLVTSSSGDFGRLPFPKPLGRSGPFSVLGNPKRCIPIYVSALRSVAGRSDAPWRGIVRPQPLLRVPGKEKPAEVVLTRGR